MTQTPMSSYSGSGSPRGIGRMAVLDGLRFLAAVAVMLFHFTARSNPSWGQPVSEVFPALQPITSLGAFGVDLFFVISGFVIPLTAWGRGIGAYTASRISRLYPAYWAGVLLTGFLLLVLWPDRRDLDVTTVMVNLTMLQEAFGYGHVDGVYWTLWAELRFYLILGVLVVIGVTTGRLLALAAVWPPLAALAELSGMDFLATMLVSDYAPLFAGGIALYVLSRNSRSVIAWLVLAENVLIGASWSAERTQDLIQATTRSEISTATAALAVVACFALVAAATLTRLRHFSATWLTTAGLLTYPLYLLHEYWGWWVIHLLHDRLPVVVTLAAAIAVVLVLAWLVHRLVERPLGRRMRRALDRDLVRVGV